MDWSDIHRLFVYFVWVWAFAIVILPWSVMTAIRAFYVGRVLGIEAADRTKLKLAQRRRKA